ncbi:serine/threonine-protein kinase [Microbispora sp. H11081]|uniref:serine/threonine-protein kinase n=1 Tax=Microbispora sp. H11081 TaxID=2729107 RepID=UPI001475CB6B|nr:serine/threonine-protein kinase [Microbispora sp. H11081]
MVAQGTTLAGRYRLDARLGAGGMGEVWRGEDTVLARTVAVKVLLPGRLDDPGFAVRFQGEARAMATVNHPGVVDVYDYGVTDVPGDGSTAYLVMRFVDGEPLDRLLARLGRIAAESAMELIAQAASALQAVHERGIVHRDVKPGNLLVRSDGTLVLTDFGIARADQGTRLTDAGMVLGTAAYCAPEQAEGAPVTPAVDIYALGVVAYECLAGQRPFDGESPVAIALKHIREEPPPLPPHVPPAVRAVVERAMSKDPALRWPSAAAMSHAARQSVLPPGSVPDAAPAYGPPGPVYGPQGTAGAGYGPQGPGAVYGPQGLTATPAGTGMAATPPPGGVPTQAHPHPVAPEPVPSTGHTYRVTRESWNDAPAVPPTTAASPQQGSRAARRAAQRSKKGKGMPVAAGVAGFAVVGGLAVLGINMASAGQTDPVVPAPSLTVIAPPSPSPARTSSRPTARPTHDVPVSRPSPTKRRPSPSPSPTPSASPSRPASPTPSPSPTEGLVKVPQLKGLPESSANARLNMLGLVPKAAYEGTGECKGLVVSQKPAPNTPVKEGTAVTFTVKKTCPSPTPSPSPSPAATRTPVAS